MSRIGYLTPWLLLFFISPAPADEPAEFSMVGNWTWTWKDEQGNTHRHVLEVEGKPGAYVARERFDEMESVKVNDLKVEGKEVNFTVLRDQRKALYAGKFAERDTINGTVSVAGADNQPREFGWTARRQAAKSTSR